MSDDLERSRARLEAGLDDLRHSVESEVGWLPRASRWALPIVASAVGLVIGLALRRGLPRLGRGDG